jgi:hypothetical protein
MEFIAVTGKRPLKAATKRLMPRALSKHPTTMENTFSMLARGSPPTILSKKILSIPTYSRPRAASSVSHQTFS